MIQLLLLCGGLIALPLVLEKLFKKPRGSLGLLWAAGIVSAVAIVLTEQFDGTNRLANFTEHFFGGGVPAGLVFIYLRRHLGKLSILQELCLLFFFVSGFGALNELLEFLLDQTTARAYSTDRWDTWYDILANCLGVLTGWLIWKVYTSVRTIE